MSRVFLLFNCNGTKWKHELNKINKTRLSSFSFTTKFQVTSYT